MSSNGEKRWILHFWVRVCLLFLLLLIDIFSQVEEEAMDKDNKNCSKDGMCGKVRLCLPPSWPQWSLILSSETCLSLTEYLPNVETQKGWRHMNEEIISSWIRKCTHTYTKSCIQRLRKHFRPVPYSYPLLIHTYWIKKIWSRKWHNHNSTIKIWNYRRRFRDLHHHFIGLDWFMLDVLTASSGRVRRHWKTIMLQETDVMNAPWCMAWHQHCD